MQRQLKRFHMAQRNSAIESAVLTKAADAVADATGLLVLAGAGIGVDSGLPDFRGDSGFWRAYPSLRSSATRLTDIASPSMFRSDPRLAWGFYGHRLRLYRETTPHDGFRILRSWCESMRDGWWVSTTNVDGHFQKAGFDAKYVHECHGSIHDLQCSKPCGTKVWPSSRIEPRVDDELRWSGALPLCPRCSEIARPDILMFGDDAWVGDHAEVRHAQLLDWLPEVQRLLVVEIGAGTAVPTLRLFSERLVRQRRARLVRINTRESDVPYGECLGLRLGSLPALTAIDEIRRSNRERSRSVTRSASAFHH